MNKLIAIVGMCGSGKSVATEILENKGWQKIYFGGVTLTKMKEAGIERTAESEKAFREKLREEYGPECYARLLHEDIELALSKGNVVLDGLYSWYEYKYLIKHFPHLKMVAIVTDKALRYKRISERQVRSFTKEEAIKRDIAEIENLYKGGPIAYADYFIFNNSSLSEYETRLEEVLKSIMESDANE